MRTILLVDDEPEVGALLLPYLSTLGWRLVQVTDGLAGLEAATKGGHDLIIIDITLPQLNGLDLCRLLRAAAPDLPLVILSGSAGESDKILGFERGADDFVTKPFSVHELGARMQALLRRSDLRRVEANQRTSKTRMQLGALALDGARREAWVANERLGLTYVEFELLSALITSNERALSRADLAERLWGYTPVNYEDTITTYVSRLRHKVERFPSTKGVIQTVHGFGYRLAALP